MAFASNPSLRFVAVLTRRKSIVKLTISLQVTLDGVAQANGGNNEDMDPGFTRGGWALPLGDDEGVQYILDTWRRPEAFLMGRKTFELFATYWGARSRDGGFGEAISSKAKYVVSNTMSDPTWEGSTVISGDVAAEIRKLKEQPSGELLLTPSHIPVAVGPVPDRGLLVGPITTVRPTPEACARGRVSLLVTPRHLEDQHRHTKDRAADER
jgi:dihydrofolate reductase